MKIGFAESSLRCKFSPQLWLLDLGIQWLCISSDCKLIISLEFNTIDLLIYLNFCYNLFK